MIPRENPRTYDGSDAPRKCGSCRYWHRLPQMPEQGKCVHPERRDLMTLVRTRQRELACRDVWGDDLWESSGMATPALDAVLAADRRMVPLVTERIEGTH